MAFINFDQEQRRDNKEPQTTKRELLRGPPPASDSPFSTYLNTPRGAMDLNDLYGNTSTWNFNAVGDNATPSGNEILQVKQEMASPMQDRGNDKRHHTPTNNLHEPASKRARRALAARQTSDERFGRKTGVIDLTLDESSSDEEDEQPFPERQFVPRADENPLTTRSAKRKTPTPPRTFTKGLSPIAAHPRRAPIVHRSKPPIKPGNRRQTIPTPSPAPTGRPVFNRPPRPTTPAKRDNTPRTTSSARSATTFSQPAPARPSTAKSSTTPIQKKAAGPFVEDDDESDEDEVSATKAHGRGILRASMVKLIDRPRYDTPHRAEYARMVAESETMRLLAHKRQLREAGGATNSPDSDSVDQPQVSTQSSEDQSFLGLPHPR